MSGLEHCGELRLIYRLAYQDINSEESRYSRLPFTLNAVMFPKSHSKCRDVSRQLGQIGPSPSAQSLSKLLEFYSFGKLEVNVQISRYPSGLETEFAGQAVYLLQVYAPNTDGLAPIELENTPAVSRIMNNDELRQDFIDEINANISGIDAGTHRLSRQFLATEALSYSTNGLNRIANKPYDVILGHHASELNVDIDTPLREIKSRESLIEKLNNSSCMGCHQSQSTAGFHYSRDRANAGLTNRIAIPFSGHFLADQKRRRLRITSEANGVAPTLYRAHAARPANLSKEGAKTGETCTPNPKHWAKGFGWGCADERDECKVLASDSQAQLQFGTCVRKDVSEISSGMACRKGVMTSHFSRKASTHHSIATPIPIHLSKNNSTHYQKTIGFLLKYNCRPTRWCSAWSHLSNLYVQRKAT